MDVEFSNHSEQRLKQRQKIKKSMVLETINNPDAKQGSYKDRLVLRKNYGKEILEVVCKKEDNKIIVITQYLLET